ncbi:MAG TPA: CPBP family intramembrane glutamic endopeptidase [Cyclobacteriaceae bacterium]|nr:CPBP family intramembrane glutamic endopeptidase [Cyclobacteriaceae bacterium]
MELEQTVSDSPRCPHCSTVIQTDARFCGKCGKQIKHEVQAHHPTDVFEHLGPVLLFYFITLILLIVYKFTSTFPEGINGMLVVSVIDIVIVIVFWVYNHYEVKPLFSFANVKFSVAILTVLGALLGSLSIFFLADLIQISISDHDVFYNPYLFGDTPYPMLLSILFICVQPAIFEEVAFRGFMFNNLQRVSSPIGAIYITSFIFGIIHLAFISMLWLVPLGLAFAFLRYRYNTLWYGVIGHFTYNLGITLLEFYWY